MFPLLISLLLFTSTSGQGKFFKCLRTTTDDSHLGTFPNATSCWRSWGMTAPIICLPPGLHTTNSRTMFFCPFEGDSADDFSPRQCQTPPPCPPPSPNCPAPQPCPPPLPPNCPPHPQLNCPAPQPCPPPQPANCPAPQPCPPPLPPNCPPHPQLNCPAPQPCPSPTTCPSAATTTTSSILLTTTTTIVRCPTTHWALFGLFVSLFYIASASSGFAIHWGLQKRRRGKRLRKAVKAALQPTKATDVEDGCRPSEIMPMMEMMERTREADGCRPSEIMPMMERPREAPPRPPNAPTTLIVDVRPELERKRDRQGIGKVARSAISPLWAKHDKPAPTFDATSSDEWSDREDQPQPSTSAGGPAIPTSSPEILQAIGLPTIHAQEEEESKNKEEGGGEEDLISLAYTIYFDCL